MKQKIISFFLLLFLFSLVYLPFLTGSVLAQSGDPVTDNLIATKNAAGLPEAELTSVVGGIIKVFFGILGVLLVIYFLWGGYTWMTAAGEPDKVKKAKEMLRNAIIGFIIVFISYSIALFVMVNLKAATT
ncbi:MAG: pilin [Patescibacteria group bacterium]